MKILYGVQATGQGHISRARAMAAALARYDIEVTWLFSGRPRPALFDMEPFGDFQHRRGLSFATRAGRIRYRATLKSNNLPEFMRDVRTLDVDRYDAIVNYATTVTDTGVETVGAWLKSRQPSPSLRFPEVAPAVARWLANGSTATPAQLASSLWSCHEGCTAGPGAAENGAAARESVSPSMRKLGQNPQIS